MNAVRLAIAASIFFMFCNFSFAQTTSFEEFQRKVNEGVAEIAKYQEVLQNPDVRVQYQAVQYMLKTNDPALQRIAKEHALFSTNPVLRNSAIKAIFDSGQNVRLVITSTGEKSVDTLGWLQRVGGTHDGNTGSIIFKVGEARENCWIQYRDKCHFQLAGNSVRFNHEGNSGYGAQSSLDLGNDGVLRGMIFTRKGEARLSIDLKE